MLEYIRKVWRRWRGQTHHSGGGSPRQWPWPPLPPSPPPPGIEMKKTTPTLLNVIKEALPRSLVVDPPLTDEQFEALCLATENVRMERSSLGVIEVHPPACAHDAGGGNVEILSQLYDWWRAHRAGLVFDWNTGFYLPDGSMRSPDAAYVTTERLKGVSLGGLPRCCPDFVIEIRFTSDPESLNRAQAKMHRWIANGVMLGWLVSPPEQTVYVYAPHPTLPTAQTCLKLQTNFITGRGPVEGFVLNLAEVWKRYP